MKKGTDRFFVTVVFDNSVPPQRIVENLVTLYCLQYPFKFSHDQGKAIFEITFPNEYCWLLFKQITTKGALNPMLLYFKFPNK